MKELFKDLKKESRDYYLSELNAQDSISEKFIDLRSLSLGIIQDLYDKRLVETKEDKEKVLKYLLPLLKNNELVMLSFELNPEKRLENGECEIESIYIGDKKTADEAIKLLKKSWIHCDDERSLNLLELNTIFVLPKNKEILNWYKDEVWKFTEPVDEIGFRYKEKK